ncbi:hypothetical protein B4110_3479 [Parageobacillus toebii]|uniref:Uncharacterized protein n=1 Tax=Parageobacillus toebii TaxID=153151 RepID=A0A150MHS3_9BACL|nr:hypothetical protein B4110_3479 [Parageobacillus toebii]
MTLLFLIFTIIMIKKKIEAIIVKMLKKEGDVLYPFTKGLSLIG